MHRYDEKGRAMIARQFGTGTITPQPFKAIRTHHMGPTNTRGSRIIASEEAGHRAIVPYDYALSSEDNHAEACRVLVDRMEWKGSMIGAYIGKGEYAWVFCE